MKRMFLAAMAVCICTLAYGKRPKTVEVFDFTQTYETVASGPYLQRLTTDEKGGYVYHIGELTLFALPDSNDHQRDRLVITENDFTMTLSRNGQRAICRPGRKKMDALDENRCAYLISRINLHFY